MEGSTRQKAFFCPVFDHREIVNNPKYFRQALITSTLDVKGCMLELGTWNLY